MAVFLKMELTGRPTYSDLRLESLWASPPLLQLRHSSGLKIAFLGAEVPADQQPMGRYGPYALVIFYETCFSLFFSAHCLSNLKMLCGVALVFRCGLFLWYQKHFCQLTCSQSSHGVMYLTNKCPL